MKFTYSELKDIKKASSCIISRLFVRYPKDTENEELNSFFENQAERFSEYVKRIAYEKSEMEFSEYMENGGRRSGFMPNEYKLEIKICDAIGEYVSIKTEAISTKGGTVNGYNAFYTVWSIKSGQICYVRDFLKKKPKKRYDGFYLKDGKIIFYSLNDIWKSRDCSSRDIKSFITEATPISIFRVN